MRINIRHLSLIIFVLPIFTIITSFIISVNLEIIPFCIPNIDGCTSISRVGRYEPVKYFFKPLMYLFGVLLIFYWKENYLKLKTFTNDKQILFASIIGVISVIFLFLYIFFLGESNIYRFFRKIGIYIYIFFTVISQLLLAIQYYKIRNKTKKFLNKKFIKYKLILSTFLILFGLSILPILLKKIEHFPEIKNIISWNYFFCIQLYYLITFFCWKPISLVVLPTRD
jgi:hypothetical protein